MTFEVGIKEYANVFGRGRYEDVVGQLSFTDKHEFAEKVRTNSLGVVLGSISDERFGYSRIIDATSKDLGGIDLSNTEVGWNIEFDYSDLSGANLSGGRFFSGKFNTCNLTNADLRNSNFDHAHLQYATLTDTKLEGASFNQTHLGGADCRDVDFRGVDLRGTKFRSFFVDEKPTDLRGAILSGTQALHANFRDAHCEGADFLDADLHGANFWGAKLNKANFTGANLGRCRFWSAEMNQTNLSRCRNTLSADFRFTSIDNTIWQNRFGFERHVRKNLTIPINNFLTLS